MKTTMQIPRIPATRSALALIELLVVIAIIAILTAMLLPARRGLGALHPFPPTAARAMISSVTGMSHVGPVKVPAHGKYSNPNP